MKKDSVSKKEVPTGSVSDSPCSSSSSSSSIHTYIHTHTTKQIPTRKTIYLEPGKATTIYISENRKETVAKLLGILEREGVSFSSWLFKGIVDYVRLHEPGNPQQRLDVISELGKAYHADKCFECKAKPLFKVFYEDGKNVLLCKECYGRQLFKLKGWIRL